MKAVIKLLCLTVALIFLASTKNFSQTGFEGKVTIKLVDDGETNFMNYLVKGNKFRMEFKDEESGGEASMIMDMKEMKMITIMPEQKMYMEYPLKKAMEEHKAEMKEEMEKVRVTDETKEINGFNCTKIVSKDDGENVEAWVTKELGNFMFFEGPMGGGEMPDWYSEFSDAGFFPILVIERDDDGEEESRWEVTKVEKKSLSDDLFVPPAGYEKMDIPMMDFLK
jgi:hypothetical protein